MHDNANAAPKVYVISARGAPSRIKVGYCTGTKDELRKRYRTTIPDIQFHLFCEHPDAKRIEREFHSSMRHKSVKDGSGNRSEVYDGLCVNAILTKLNRLGMDIKLGILATLYDKIIGYPI